MRTCKDMTYHAGIVLRIYPSNEQKRIIAANDGAGRFIYNRLVALDRERYRLSKYADLIPAYRDRMDYIDSVIRNPDKGIAQCLKNVVPFCYEKDIDSLAIDNSIKNYRAAWSKYKEDPIHNGIPAFHKKGYSETYQTNAHYDADAVCINDSNVRFPDKKHIILPKIGEIRIAGSKKRIAELIDRPDTRIGTITVCKDVIGRYFVSLQLASDKPFAKNLPMTLSSAGIDLNIENFLWDSNNNVVENPKVRRKIQKQLAEIQQSISRKAVRAKKEGRLLSECKNYQKERLRAAHLQIKIRGKGDDFRHVVSKRYVESQDIIAAEDLKVKNLLKNHKLALAISECGWSDFLRKLEYKCAMYGKRFIKVPPQYTTQTCSSCGYVMRGGNTLQLNDREWICPECGTYHVRDYNAAKNILAKGLAILCDEAPVCSTGNAKICPGDDNSPGKALITEPLLQGHICDKSGVSAKVESVETRDLSFSAITKPAALAAGS